MSWVLYPDPDLGFPGDSLGGGDREGGHPYVHGGV